MKKSNLLPHQVALRQIASEERAAICRRFFKTGPGQYGEGDEFIGVAVPDVRKIAKLFAQSSQKDLLTLMKSKTHEDRLLGLIILADLFDKIQKGTPSTRSEMEKIVKFYLKVSLHINNWDLVDTSCRMLGEYCLAMGDYSLLHRLSRSKNHWERRMAVIATFPLIRANQTSLTYLLAQRFLSETQDLMHKATGWMLREAGKKDPDRLRKFISEFGSRMPRTMLRYSIEKFTKKEQAQILLSTRSQRKLPPARREV